MSKLLSCETSALALIDMQALLLPAMDEEAALLKSAEILLEGATHLDVPILVSEQYPKGLGKTLPSLTTHTGGAPVFEKTHFSCCACEEWITALATSGRNQIVICGIESHVCVLQTTIDLLEKGCEVFVVADAVSSRSPRNKEIALARMAQAGATITCVESVLFEWLRVAEGAVFKTIAKLIR